MPDSALKYTPVLLCLLLASLCGWALFEGDLFYLLRAGHEMWTQKAVITTELWSHTAQGLPWLNHQWLAELLLAGLEQWLGVSGLPVIRVLLVLGILLLSLRTASKHSAQPLTQLTLIALVFTILYPRIQLRSELFAFALFAFQVFYSQKQESFFRSVVMHSAVVLLWAQLHTGSAWIGGLYALCTLPTPEKRWAWLAGFIPISMIFVTPLGGQVLHVLLDHSRLQNNPELWGFRWEDLNPLREGLTYSASWMALGLLFGFSRSRKWGRAEVFIILILAVSLYRTRALPYFALAVVPMLAQTRLPRFVTASATAMLLVSTAMLLATNERPYGFAVHHKQLPVDVANFVRSEGLQGPLLNHYNFGAYFLWALPEIPVAIDGRETPFTSFEKELTDARKSPESWRQLLMKYKICLVIDTKPDQTAAESYRSFYPPTEWAAVYADHLSVVLVRREFAPAELIKDREIPY